MRRLALLDVDGTLTPVRSVWQYLLEKSGRWRGSGDENLRMYLAGEIDYNILCHRDASLFAGEAYADLVAIAEQIPVNEGVAELVSALRDRGYKVVLVSTGLRVLTSILQVRLGIDACIANDLEAIHGTCTGNAVIEILETEKGVHARELIERFQSDHTLAIGDGSGDIPMFHEVDLAIAVGHAAEAVRAAAHLVHPTLDLAGVVDLIDVADGERLRT